MSDTGIQQFNRLLSDTDAVDILNAEKDSRTFEILSAKTNSHKQQLGNQITTVALRDKSADSDDDLFNARDISEMVQGISTRNHKAIFVNIISNYIR